MFDRTSKVRMSAVLALISVGLVGPVGLEPHAVAALVDALVDRVAGLGVAGVSGRGDAGRALATGSEAGLGAIPLGVVVGRCAKGLGSLLLAVHLLHRRHPVRGGPGAGRWNRSEQV